MVTTRAADTPRVVVTGVGVVSPIGIGHGAFWNSLRSGTSGIDYLRSIPADQLPVKLAAEIPEFDPRKYISDRKFIKVMSRDTQLGVAASRLAVDDSGIQLGDVDPTRVGVVFGAGRMTTTPDEVSAAVDTCSDDNADFQFTRWGEDSMGRIAPLWMLRQLPNMPACHVSIAHNAQGPNNTITSRDASALLALSEAVRVIERGAADCMIVGSCNSSIHPVNLARLSLSDGLSRRNADPTRACRPFDIERDGTIVGEGAATFVVEEYNHAVRRGAEIYGEVIGIGAGCDGFSRSDSSRGAGGLMQAIKSAMSRASVSPKDIGHINADGKSTQRDDLLEAFAYRRAFGDEADRIPITALKSYFGHFDAGSGAVELAGTILALRHRELPHTLNYEKPDPLCRVNVIHEGPVRLSNLTAMSVNRTTVGQSAACILRAI